MTTENLKFYEPLARFYHLIFEDWEASIARQAKILDALLRAQFDIPVLEILDCACGIGTQALGLAQRGHHVVASDLSPAAVNRATLEAKLRNRPISFHVSDMTTLAGIPGSGYDAVVAMDNALPHLTQIKLRAAVCAMASKLQPGGILMASIRDYDSLLLTRPAMQVPAFYGEKGARRIVHQVWDWAEDGSAYDAHLYLTLQQGDGWVSHHFAGVFRPLKRAALTAILKEAGFDHVQWVMPGDSGFYQPIVVARKLP